MLHEFAKESAITMKKLELGFSYEIFAPLAYRYASLLQGDMNVARAWRGTLRTDMPKDDYGIKAPKNTEDHIPVATHLKKQSADLIVGKSMDSGKKVDKLLQLKAWTSVEELLNVYDLNVVGIHYEDASILFNVGLSELSKLEAFTKLSDNEKSIEVDNFVGQLLVLLAEEIASRTSNNEHAGQDSKSLITVLGTSINIEIPFLLDGVILPIYTRMLEEQDLSTLALSKN